ncbi:AAA family ATPase [Archangium gephyra]|uniref:AAA family ATPase n=1 Tax=Archangium gephyra TaxID=48 RepID=UPI00094AA19B|nr:AAA family ATPase [Archangium gephyra]
MKYSLVVGVAGGIGSGKTEFAHQLASAMHASFLSFGDYVRRRATTLGMDLSRDNLQALGERLISEMGWDEFVGDVLLSWSRSEPLILDGIRHEKAVESIKKLVAPANFSLVYLSVDKTIRVGRLSTVRPHDAIAIERLEQHSTERDVHSKLSDLADIVLDGSRAVPTLVQDALEALHLS